MVEIVSNDKARFLCPHCDKTYSSKSGVKGHMRTKHVDAAPVNTDNSPQEKQQSNVPNDNLDTNELDSLLEEEEEFLDAVENLENEIGLGVDLSVNESMMKYYEDGEHNKSNISPVTLRSDFARTLELEENTNRIFKDKELETAKKNIYF